MTRWITLHATHNVTLQRNVGWKSIGHGFYLEDGTEITIRGHPHPDMRDRLLDARPTLREARVSPMKNA